MSSEHQISHRSSYEQEQAYLQKLYDEVFADVDGDESSLFDSVDKFFVTF